MRQGSQDKGEEAAFWDRVARQRVYAAFDDDEYAAIFDRAMGGDLQGKRVIDIGSASGVSAALMAARGATVLGIDISQELVTQANALWRDYGDRLSFAVGDAEHLDVPDASVDICFFGGVLHHLVGREKACAEARRILVPGGRFVAIEPNRGDVFERIEWAVADLRGKLAPSEYPIDPLALRRELRAEGFHDVQYWLTRSDIPVLNQVPVLKRFFSRQKGFWFKRPMLRFVDAFRPPEQRGTFFVISGVKP